MVCTVLYIVSNRGSARRKSRVSKKLSIVHYNREGRRKILVDCSLLKETTGLRPVLLLKWRLGRLNEAAERAPVALREGRHHAITEHKTVVPDKNLLF